MVSQFPSHPLTISHVDIVIPLNKLGLGLDNEITFFRQQLGFHLKMIMPADDPNQAILEAHGIRLHLRPQAGLEPPLLSITLNAGMKARFPKLPSMLTSPHGTKIEIISPSLAVEIPKIMPEFSLSLYDQNNGFHQGRAGMNYRDLIPSRWGGAFGASHIRLPNAGKIPDHVHFHKVKFQMIYCLKGTALLAYENQGDPFIFEAGDCVLQPPGIRHIVMECSEGFEVVEVNAPALHETFIDDDISLRPEFCTPQQTALEAFTQSPRLWQVEEGNAQAFCLSKLDPAADQWKADGNGLEWQDTGIEAASNGLGKVQVGRTIAGLKPDWEYNLNREGEFYFFMLLEGELDLKGSFLTGTQRLKAKDCFTAPQGGALVISNPKDSPKWLEVVITI